MPIISAIASSEIKASIWCDTSLIFPIKMLSDIVGDSPNLASKSSANASPLQQDDPGIKAPSPREGGIENPSPTAEAQTSHVEDEEPTPIREEHHAPRPWAIMVIETTEDFMDLEDLDVHHIITATEGRVYLSISIWYAGEN
ncbi:uncharacterized protein EV420DRAFT_1483842 [Desarmillaria tabescens]|uniref:Uncharacterized protein n=1 Tax=Armillaria tabescens TaxID=1929756 RepID=A0AA39JTA9_ARMTA|nr:uncharacterized protein EV420DRAFT_1483842 [Desarmillaria tabescens]KAK0447495.1 hypothetical protein EV420DRAFT_1483842 [Desarmillaria tabescens]